MSAIVATAGHRPLRIPIPTFCISLTAESTRMAIAVVHTVVRCVASRNRERTERGVLLAIRARKQAFETLFAQRPRESSEISLCRAGASPREGPRFLAHARRASQAPARFAILPKPTAIFDRASRRHPTRRELGSLRSRALPLAATLKQFQNSLCASPAGISSQFCSRKTSEIPSLAGGRRVFLCPRALGNHSQ